MKYIILSLALFAALQAGLAQMSTNDMTTVTIAAPAQPTVHVHKVAAGSGTALALAAILAKLDPDNATVPNGQTAYDGEFYLNADGTWTMRVTYK